MHTLVANAYIQIVPPHNRDTPHAHSSSVLIFVLIPEGLLMISFSWEVTRISHAKPIFILSPARSVFDCLMLRRIY